MNPNLVPAAFSKRMNTDTAIFAAGCFWSVEAGFRRLPGVVDAVAGYTGGFTENPTYHEVDSDRTGHAEAVKVTFDPQQISYDELVNAFWNLHDPTQGNRQGLYIGSQYRSAIFTNSSEQEAVAKASRDHLQTILNRPIATEIAPAEKFWRAEEQHQRYYERHGIACEIPL